ncbi:MULTISPECIES: thioredoxin family protein [unclassified Dehalobacter]|jgi:Thioredoxin domain-containing protein|uniref:thioredoxin family protein n=1 Tax=unclassified Dehalobacter TaxID=2635733 RepID=UPI00028B644D|nr:MULTISPECIES: thioredoxin family protein [unclassified Dehalobacter]AFV01188.1 Thioredoxin [Dehalobacter sp. DCA]AFV04230.1 Thioredoxin [Dehalobacter sp. CF]
MENSQKESMFKKHALKIIIPILIILAIGAIWFIKNDEQKPMADNIVGSDISTAESADFALHVTEKLDLEKLKSYGLPIMIDFGADSCIPCKEMAPVLAKLNEELQGKAIIKFVDVWKYQELAEGYPISVIPTQVFFDKDGKPYTPSDPKASQMKMYSLKDTNEHVFTTHEGGMTEETIRAALKEMGLKE